MHFFCVFLRQIAKKLRQHNFLQWKSSLPKITANKKKLLWTLKPLKFKDTIILRIEIIQWYHNFIWFLASNWFLQQFACHQPMIVWSDSYDRNPMIRNTKVFKRLKKNEDFVVVYFIYFFDFKETKNYFPRLEISLFLYKIHRPEILRKR